MCQHPSYQLVQKLSIIYFNNTCLFREVMITLPHYSNHYYYFATSLLAVHHRLTELEALRTVRARGGHCLLVTTSVSQRCRSGTHKSRLKAALNTLLVYNINNCRYSRLYFAGDKQTTVVLTRFIF